MKICGFNQIEKEATLILTTASMQSYVKLGRLMMTLEAAGPAEAPEPIRKQPLLYFDFVEICGGAGKVSDALLNLGRSVAPVLDCPTARTVTFPVLGFASGSFT